MVTCQVATCNRNKTRKNADQKVASGQRILTTGRIAGDFWLGKFNMTLDCFCGRPIGTLVNSMQENPDVTRSKLPFLVGIWTPSNT